VPDSASGNITISDFEAMFPMSKEAETSIVHKPPGVPIIINSVCYKSEDVTLFNGQRLRYIFNNNGILYAFTSVEGLEKFITKEYGELKQTNDEQIKSRSLYANFWEDMGYEGWCLSVSSGVYIEDLGPKDNQISSAGVDSGITAAVLFEDEDYEGDYFYIPGGTNYYLLMTFNDMTSSLAVLE
jgi:hypothetical protein